NYRCRSDTFTQAFRGDGQLPIKTMQPLHYDFYFICFSSGDGKGGFGHSDLDGRERATNAETVKLIRAATVEQARYGHDEVAVFGRAPFYLWIAEKALIIFRKLLGFDILDPEPGFQGEAERGGLDC